MNRRSVALGIVLGGGVALASAGYAVEAVQRLSHARQAQTDLTAAQTTAPVTSRLDLPDPQWHRARDRKSASDAIALDLRTTAARAGVLVELAAPQPGDGQILAIKIRLSGPETSVITFVDTLERAQPMTRLANWRMRALPDGGVRVDAVLVAAWRP